MERKKQRILIVDDIAQNITVLYTILRSEYSIVVAKNGLKALEIARTDNPPDLILLDIMMPEMDGYQVLQELKADERTRLIPVVFVSAKDDSTDKATGYKLGVSDYLTKPVDPSQVMRVVKSMLQRQDDTERY